MGQKSNIEWCDSTVNFWSGCTKVSPGCAHCYAETLSNNKFFGGGKTIGKWGNGAPRRLHESAFKMAFALNRKPWICDACGHAQPQDLMCGKCGKNPHHRRRIFSLSLGDWLDDEVSIEWLARMLDTIRQCDQVTWILCTKRPENFESRLLSAAKFDESIAPTKDAFFHKWLVDWLAGDAPTANIILLASVENQEQADKRVPQLLKIPAVCRGLSLEPLLGPVDLTHITDKARFPGAAHFDVLNGRMIHHDDDMRWTEDGKVDWLIIGGESGTGARPCNVEWIRSLVKQGKEAGVATLVKQLGSNVDCFGSKDPMDYPLLETVSGRPDDYRPNLRDKKGGDMAEWPEDLKVREWPKGFQSANFTN